MEITHNFSRNVIFNEYEIYTLNQHIATKDKQQTVYI